MTCFHTAGVSDRVESETFFTKGVLSFGIGSPNNLCVPLCVPLVRHIMLNHAKKLENLYFLNNVICNAKFRAYYHRSNREIIGFLE